MDGHFPLDAGFRRTLKAAIGCVGIGLHSGRRVALTLRPALPGTGIRFHRTDLGGVEIPARHDFVVDTRLCTALALPGRPEARIATVEHVMAALAGCGVDDAIVEVNGPEVPILDGSAAPFVFLIDCAGVTGGIPAPGAPGAIEVLRPVRVQEGEGPDAAWAELLPPSPGGEGAFEAELTIEFAGTAIGRQSMTLRVTEASFRESLAEARTFALAQEVERLRAAGLAQGGSLANAVVVEGPVVLNPEGLRHPQEFVRHKLMDAVGDLALAGAPLRGRFRGHRSGHGLNNRVLRALFADQAAWRRTTAPAWMAEGGASSVSVRLPAAAAPSFA